MSYISVVLVPVFRHQKDYWWVSLIIIGVVLIAYPFYVRACPAGLSDADRIAVFTKQGEATYVAVGAVDDSALTTEEVYVQEKGVELKAVDEASATSVPAVTNA